MKRVSNFNQLHKAGSMQAMALAVVVGLQEALPFWETIVPENAFAITAAVIATAGMVLRGIDQGLGSSDDA